MVKMVTSCILMLLELVSRRAVMVKSKTVLIIYIRATPKPNWRCFVDCEYGVSTAIDGHVINMIVFGSIRNNDYARRNYGV